MSIPFLFLALATTALATAAGPLAGVAPLRGQAEEEAASSSTDSRPGEFAVLAGRVLSATTAEPIEGAVVSLRRARVGAITDAAGEFRIPRAVAGEDTVAVRYLGEEVSAVTLGLEPGATTRVVFLLSPDAIRLADLEVTVEREATGILSGFERRREKGIGHFIGPEEIEERSPRHTSDLLRRIPGVRVGPSRTGGRAYVTLGRTGRRCVPVVFLDGIHARGMEVDEVPTTNLEALEIYRGPAEIPAEFANQAPAACGAILVWTRRGDRGS